MDASGGAVRSEFVLISVVTGEKINIFFLLCWQHQPVTAVIFQDRRSMEGDLGILETAPVAQICATYRRG